MRLALDLAELFFQIARREVEVPKDGELPDVLWAEHSCYTGRQETASRSIR